MYDLWLKLIRLLVMTNDRDASTQDTRRNIVVNVLLTAYLLFCSVRMGFSGLIPGLSYHVFGHSLMHFGNTSQLLQVFAGLAFLQVALE